MRHTSSSFFANFSVARLVKKCGSPSAVACSGGGMGGGGMGSGFHATGSKESRYQKSDSFSCRLRLVEGSEFDASEVMRSLKADVEKEIIDSGGSVGRSDELQSGFRIEYSEEGVRGSVEVTGRLSGTDYFGLRATLDEMSASEKQPATEKRVGVRQPVGVYHVVPFRRDDPRASTREFYDRGQEAIKAAVERLRQKYLAEYPRKDSPRQNIEYAEVYEWAPMAPEVRRVWEEATGEKSEVPAEFAQYGKVYFLNDVAYRMYREAGVVFEVMKTIQADEVAKMPMPGSSLRGPYISTEQN